MPVVVPVGRRVRHGRPAPLCAVVVVALVAGGLTAPAASGAEPVRYRPPVDAPVLDAFRAPVGAYGSGNRGIEYDLAPGSSVQATADGTVVFAGWVAGARHVTLRHADGRRSSYSFLDTVAVRRGDRVRAGASVGTAGPGFHFGMREDDRYVDPAPLFGSVVTRARLVPHDEPVPARPDSLAREHAALEALVRERDGGGLWALAGAALADAVALGGRTGGALVGWAGERAALAWHYSVELAGVDSVVDVAGTLWYRLRADCTAAATPVAVDAEDRTVVLVGGLGSSSRSAAVDALDLGSLGYDGGRVVRFSYRGGRVPAPSLDPALAEIAESHYVPDDTTSDVVARGVALADLVESVAAAVPGAPVDVYAHSLGGVVARVALEELARRGATDVLGQVVTLGTPHQGSDLATLGRAAGPLGRAAVGRLADALGVEADPGELAVAQVAETSPLVAGLAAAGVPDGVAFRSVGARTDLVVTADKTRVPGHPWAVVEVDAVDAHGVLPADAAVRREVELGLAGLAPACEGLGDVLADAVVPELVSRAVDQAGALVLAVSP